MLLNPLKQNTDSFKVELLFIRKVLAPKIHYTEGSLLRKSVISKVYLGSRSTVNTST